MIDGIFNRLSSGTLEAIHTSEVKKIDVDELFNALTSIKNDIQIAHLGFENLYREANYVFTRLSHMEKSMLAKAQSKANLNDKDDEGSTGGGTVGGAGVAKVMDMGSADSRFSSKMEKIQEAKNLTAELLASIEQMSLKIKESAAAETASSQLKV